MKQTQMIMGMPITIEIVDERQANKIFSTIFDYFISVDTKFSTYKSTSEISRINSGVLNKSDYSEEMKQVFLLCEKTKQETYGYFDILHDGIYDPSGLVKGWAIGEAYLLLKKKEYTNFYIEAGGDIQTSGTKNGIEWTVGIRNPFKKDEIVKILSVYNKGVATSGTYIRGQHIYNPYMPEKKLTDIVSVTVIGPKIFDADRFATAAFAMQGEGIAFIESLLGFEGYVIDKNGIATYTSGFDFYVKQN